MHAFTHIRFELTIRIWSLLDQRVWLWLESSDVKNKKKKLNYEEKSRKKDKLFAIVKSYPLSAHDSLIVR